MLPHKEMEKLHPTACWMEVKEVIEKEGLGLTMVFVIPKFYQYLCGQHFTIFTNHIPLLILIGENKTVSPLAAAWIQHWVLFL